MKKSLIIFAIIYVAISFWTGCREEYQPAGINGNNDYLVVEGIINPDSTTIFLSRTRNLNDTVSFVPESNATVTIEGERAGSFVLQRKGNGIYAIGRISVNVNDNYRLKIIARSKLYQSDFVTVKKAPPIDSLPWKQETDVAVYLNAHDPSNNTRYYRWEYEETWQHESFYDSHLGYVNGQIVFLDSSQLVHVCWSTVGSSEILLGNSSQLSSDKIENMPIVLIRSGS